MYRVIYIIRGAARNIVRNLILNLVSITTISLALLILSAFLLIYLNLQRQVESSSRNLAVTVFLNDGLGREAAEGLKAAVTGMNGVSSVQYISKEEALADLRSRLGDKGGILDGLDENPLPASLELGLEPDVWQSGGVEALTVGLESLEGVAEVHYAWGWADKLRAFVNFVKVAGLVIGGLLFLAIVFIIANTIRLTVLAREDELYIMRLMGATEDFVRAPFYIEGVIQGLCGGGVALAGLFGLFSLLVSQVQLPLGLSLVNLTFLSPPLAWFLVFVGGFMGFLGSYASMWRLTRK